MSHETPSAQDQSSESGIDRITAAFAKSKAENRPALMPFVVAGDPVNCPIEALLEALAKGDSDVIELGFPFSDPIADGPVIAAAMHRALERGVQTELIFESVAKFRRTSDVPIVAMVSESIVRRHGHQAFVYAAAEAGIAGVIVPDADYDDIDELLQACVAKELAFIPLIAPTSTPSRQEQLVANASGFVYLLARAGITGERGEAPEVQERVEALRMLTDLPIAVGFGISTAAHVRQVGVHAEGAIVGSALVRCLSNASDAGSDVATVASEFVAGL